MDRDRDEMQEREAMATTQSEVPRRTILFGLVGVALAGCGSEDGAATGSAGAGTGAGAGAAGGAGAGAGPGSGGAGPGVGGGGEGGGGPGGGEGPGSGGAGPGVGGSGGECAAFDPSCEETADNPLGPYYRPGAPFTSKLDNPLGTGDPLVISGRVFAADCVTPLAGAVVEVWQADANGDYDNEKGDPGPNVWVLRASIAADDCGSYQYETIMPGRYLNGGTYRPAHIHYRVTHPDVGGEFVTQLYFAGDPFNANDSMYLPSLEIELTDMNGAQHGTFDVVLA